MMKRLALLSLLAYPAFSAFPNGYTGRISHTIPHTSKLCSGTTALTNFVHRINATNINFKLIANGGLVNNANGYDIIITSDQAGTTKLNWEIQSYDGTAGALLFNVQIPSYSCTVDTVVYIFLGNASVTTFQSPGNPYASTDYAAVYHLSNSLSLVDSTAAAHTLTNSGGVSTSGYLGNGADMSNGGSPGYLSAAASADFNLHTLGQYTISMWVKPKGQHSLDTSLFNSSPWDLYSTNASPSGWLITFRSPTSQGTYGILPINSWTHVLQTWDGTNLTTYINGSLPQSGSLGMASVGDNTGNPLYLGGTPIRNFNGIVDEIVVQKISRSADWALMDYNDMAHPDLMGTFGSVETSTPSLACPDEVDYPFVRLLPHTLGVVTTGGVSPFTYSVTAGAIPAGTSLDTSTGAITGPPSTATNYSYTIHLVDANAATSDAACTSTVQSIGYAPRIPGNTTVQFFGGLDVNGFGSWRSSFAGPKTVISGWKNWFFINGYWTFPVAVYTATQELDTLGQYTITGSEGPVTVTSTVDLPNGLPGLYGNNVASYYMCPTTGTKFQLKQQTNAGLVSVSGTTATRITGQTFDVSMIGTTVNLESTSVTVSAVPTANTLTLSAAPGDTGSTFYVMPSRRCSGTVQPFYDIGTGVVQVVRSRDDGDAASYVTAVSISGVTTTNNYWHVDVPQDISVTLPVLGSNGTGTLASVNPSTGTTPGSYTLSITVAADAGGTNAQTFSWPITIIASPGWTRTAHSTAPPAIAQQAAWLSKYQTGTFMDTNGGGAGTWCDPATGGLNPNPYGDTFGNANENKTWYYAGWETFFNLAAITSDGRWNTCGVNLFDVYNAQTLTLGAGGDLPPRPGNEQWSIGADTAIGLTSGTQQTNFITGISYNARIYHPESGNFSGVILSSGLRENSLMLLNRVINAQYTGVTPFGLDYNAQQIAQILIGMAEGVGHSNIFMTGIAVRALRRYLDLNYDANIVYAIKRWVDFMQSMYVSGKSGGWPYTLGPPGPKCSCPDNTCPPNTAWFIVNSSGADNRCNVALDPLQYEYSLNNLFSHSLAYLYDFFGAEDGNPYSVSTAAYRTTGDDAFNTIATSTGDLSTGKNFNEQFVFSKDYVDLRTNYSPTLPAGPVLSGTSVVSGGAVLR